MNSKTLHIIGNEFTRKISHPDEWWEHRIDIYEHFCLASIKNQTNHDFLLMMRICDYVPEKFQTRIHSLLTESGLTFMMFNSDKISHQEAITPYVKDFEYIYYTRIDSDDMFHKEVVNEIQSHEYSYRRVLLFQKGYCYECRENRLQHYFMPAPPFSTIMYPTEIFLDPDKQFQYTQAKSHDSLINTMCPVKLSENKIIVNVHGTNRITIYNDDRTIFKGHETETEIPSEEIDLIVKDFGISSKTYDLNIRK